MGIKLDHILPIVILGSIFFAAYHNNQTPRVTLDGDVIIKPKIHYNIYRGTDDKKDNDNKIMLKHIASGDTLRLNMWDDYLVLPDGEKQLPTKDDGTGKQVPIWKVEHNREEFILDPGWDFGTYAGYLTGKSERQDYRNFDIGIKFSPLRIYDSFATDILASPQGVGLGLSFYPRPERYGEIWKHMGVGYGSFYTVNDGERRSLLYFTISTRF